MIDARGATITDIYVKYSNILTQIPKYSCQVLNKSHVKYLDILTLNTQIFMSNENLQHDWN